MSNTLTIIAAALSLVGVLVAGDTPLRTGTDVSFTANPANIEVLVTKQLTMTCKAQRQSGFVSSITLTLNDADVALVTSHTPATGLGNTTGVVTGHLDKTGYLQVTWQYPSADQTGHWSCHVAGVTSRGRADTVTSQLDVATTNMEMKQLIDHVHDLQAEVDELKKFKSDQAQLNTKLRTHVAFAACLAGNTEVKNGQTVVFDKIYLNLGRAYSPITGFFTAPVTGTYSVGVFVNNQKNGEAQVQLQRSMGSKYLFKLLAGGHDYNPVSNSMVVHLKQGETLRVYSKTLSKLTTYYSSSWFTGFLVSVD